jgi:hypothetical protein
VAEHPEAIVPALPLERSLVSASDMGMMRLFVERISHHPVLSQDYELQMFIESEFGVCPLKCFKVVCASCLATCCITNSANHSVQFLPPAKPTKILGKLLNIGVKRFSAGGNSLSMGDTDDEFEEERTVATKAESKLQVMIKNLDKEIKARRGTEIFKHVVFIIVRGCRIVTDNSLHRYIQTSVPRNPSWQH